MGGYGSGRTSKVGRRPRHKIFVNEIPRINSFKVMPGKIAATGGYSNVRLGHLTGKATTEELTIFSGDQLLMRTPMQSSPVGYGTRYYFVCPRCERQAANLYLHRVFACSKCHNLAYLSQNASNEDRWLMKRDKLLKRYGLTFGQLTYCMKKKWMHHSTFKKAIEEFNFINDMGINIHMDRFDYPRILRLWRERKSGSDCPYIFNETVIRRYLEDEVLFRLNEDTA